MLRVVLLCIAISSARAAIACTPNICMTVLCAAVNEKTCAGGEIVRKGGFCGCCDSCVHILKEGDNCGATLLLGVPSPVKCGTGLHCEPQTGTCQRSEAEPSDSFTCAERLAHLKAVTANNTVPLVGQYIPVCEEDGSYSPRQCMGSVCYCVTSDGVKILDYSVPIGEAHPMECRCARDQFAYIQTGVVGLSFSCNDDGSYKKYACTGSVCYCIDQQGHELAGKQTVHIANLSTLQC